MIDNFNDNNVTVTNLKIQVIATSLDDLLNIYLNNNLIFRVCSEIGGGGGYYELNNFNKEYSTPINQKNNQIQIDLINSGGLFSCRNLTISYYYEWITN